MSSSHVIAVDLDGTFTFTDTLHETVLSLLRNKPLLLLLLPFWLFKGIAHLKLKVAEHCVLDVSTLPYNLPLINWLREQKTNGKKIVLCTAATDHVAQMVSNHFNLFDEVIASDEKNNLKSTYKHNVLQERYGDIGYDYVGNSYADIEVWIGASNAIVVNASEGLIKKVSKVASVTHIFPSERAGISDWLRALRLHQWLKNLLLFVPLLAAHQFDNIKLLVTLVIAFVSFSVCASSIYIINDLFDLDSDRRHPRKKNRPFASAKLPISLGVSILPLLISISIFLGASVGKQFLAVLLTYLLLTISYSFLLKRVVLVDCLTLATLYTVRVFAGAAATSLTPSFWLLAFSVFIFLSLALVKRYSELVVLSQEGKDTAHGRGYLVSDAPLVQTLGVSSGYISALVIALYVNSDDIVSFYVQPIAIWLLVPILLFWVSWVWLKATRGEMHDDPIFFAIEDKASLVVFALIVFIFIFASNGIRS